MRMNRAEQGTGTLPAVVLAAVLAAACLAADPGAGGGQAPDSSPPGILMTPGMARALGGIFTKQSLVRRYQMDEARAAEAAELVARRIMELAHGLDGPGQELIQRFVEEQLARQADGGAEGFMPKTFGREFAERMLPMMPRIRQFVRNVAHDVRPMLPMKQQLRMAGELMVLNKAIDGFEETLRTWSTGQVTDYGNPFEQREENIRKDEHGVSEQLAQARRSAENQLERVQASEWEQYIEQARTFYGLDDSQMATAESIRREMVEKLGNLLRDPRWRDGMYHNRLWDSFYGRLGIGWNHPLRVLMEDQRETLMAPVAALGDELRRRVDSIPTEAQRRSARQRVEAMLAEKGLTGD